MNIIKLSEAVEKRIHSDEPYTKSITHVLAQNGAFEVRTTKLMTTVVKNDGLFSDVEAMDESFSLNIPKIPFKIFEVITMFFREVYDKEKTEATAMVFYNETSNEFMVWIPQQSNSNANSRYQRSDDPAYNKMIEENILVMVAHSHPWAGTSKPGPSGTDNADEKESLVYMILNNVEKVPFAFVSTCPNGVRMPLTMDDVFDYPELPEADLRKMIEMSMPDSAVKRLLLKHGSEEDMIEFVAQYLPLEANYRKLFNPQDIVIPASWHQKCTRYTYTYNNRSDYVYGKDRFYDKPSAGTVFANNYDNRYNNRQMSFADTFENDDFYQKYLEEAYT